MALNKAKNDLSDALFDVFSSVFKLSDLPAGPEKDEAEKGYQALSTEMAQAIYDFVKAGEITVTSEDVVVLGTGAADVIKSTGKIS
jgi:hypothetical protein